MQRTKQRTTTTTLSGGVIVEYFRNNLTGTTFPIPPLTVVAQQATITDEEVFKLRMSFCEHELYTFTNYPYEDSVLGYGNHDFRYDSTMGCKNTEWYSLLSMGGSGRFRVPTWYREKHIRQFALRGFKSVMPTLNANGFSLLNAVYELKDLKSLKPDALTKKYNNFVSGLKDSFWRTPIKYKSGAPSGMYTSSRRGAKRVANEVGSAYLEAVFGLAPFFRDLVDILKRLGQIAERVKGLLAQEGKILTHHFGGHDKYPTSERRETILPQYEWVHTALSHSLSGMKLRLTVKYRYQCPGLHGVYSTLKGYLSAFGVDNPAKVVWNAVKWTWLFDWIVDVSSFLDQASLNITGLDCVILDACVSSKLEVVTQHWAEYGDDPRVSYLLFREVSSHYLRLNYMQIGIDEIDQAVSHLGGRMRILCALGSSRLNSAPLKPTYTQSRRKGAIFRAGVFVPGYRGPDFGASGGYGRPYFRNGNRNPAYPHFKGKR